MGPRRDGPGKRWLSESEVADLYRNRFAQAGEQVSRLSKVVGEGFAAIDLGGGRDEEAELNARVPWLAIALVPDNAGSMPLNLDTVREYGEWVLKYEKQESFVGLFDSRTRTGSGCGASRSPTHA